MRNEAQTRMSAWMNIMKDHKMYEIESHAFTHNRKTHAFIQSTHMGYGIDIEAKMHKYKQCQNEWMNAWTWFTIHKTLIPKVRHSLKPKWGWRCHLDISLNTRCANEKTTYEQWMNMCTTSLNSGELCHKGRTSNA